MLINLTTARKITEQMWQGTSQLRRKFCQLFQLHVCVDVKSRAYFSVYYYTKCALLKAGCERLKVHACNIKICMVSFRALSVCENKRTKEVYH